MNLGAHLSPGVQLSAQIWSRSGGLSNIIMSLLVPGGDRDAGHILHCLCRVLAAQPHEVPLHHVHPLQSVYPPYHCIAWVLLQCKTRYGNNDDSNIIFIDVEVPSEQPAITGN